MSDEAQAIGDIGPELLGAYQSATSYSAFGGRTPEEVRRRDEAAARYRSAVAAARGFYDAAIPALLGLALYGDQVTRAMLDLHAPKTNYSGFVCEGCEWEGVDAEEPQWPCATTRKIAELHGVTVPANFDIGDVLR